MKERIVRFEVGHNCIEYKCVNDSERCYPGSGGSHGLSGMSIRFVVKGEKGAVQFVYNTGWVPTEKPYRNGEYHSMPFDLGYHSKTPMYEGQEKMDGECEFTDGICYYDGSGLQAEKAFETLRNAGEEALWKFLEQYYDCRFEEGAFPEVPQYRKEKR